MPHPVAAPLGRVGRWHQVVLSLIPQQAQVCLAFATETANLELRLIEQACDCSMVQDGGRLKGRACPRGFVVTLGWRVLAAENKHLHVCLAFATEPTWSFDWSSKLAAAPRCKVEANSGACSTAACGTRVESACRCATRHRQVCLAFAKETANLELRLLEQALRLLHGTRWRRTQGASSSAA